MTCKAEIVIGTCILNHTLMKVWANLDPAWGLQSTLMISGDTHNCESGKAIESPRQGMRKYPDHFLISSFQAPRLNQIPKTYYKNCT